MTNTDTQRELLLAAAEAVDALVGDLPRQVTDYPVPTFRSDMSDALSGDELVTFSVEDVLEAMHNWSVIAVRRAHPWDKATQS